MTFWKYSHTPAMHLPYPCHALSTGAGKPVVNGWQVWQVQVWLLKCYTCGTPYPFRRYHRYQWCHGVWMLLKLINNKAMQHQWVLSSGFAHGSTLTDMAQIIAVASSTIIFLLDIMEVPEVCYVLQLWLTLLIVASQSHTGDVLARAFHKMLVEHGLTQKVSMMAPAPLPLLTSDLDLDICWWQHDIEQQADSMFTSITQCVWICQLCLVLQPHDAIVCEGSALTICLCCFYHLACWAWT